MPDSEAHRIATPEALRAVIGEKMRGIDLKNTSALDEYSIDFIQRSPFLVLSTSDAQGNQDTSPKGDGPGFVIVEDEHTLVIPDRPGNKLVYGLSNILENPHVGLLFLLPGTPETVRVNGTAELTSDPELLQRMAARGKPAVLAIRVRVDECFFHCAKALMRSKLWQPDSWSERVKFSFGKMFTKWSGGEGPSADEIDKHVEEDYRTRL